MRVKVDRTLIYQVEKLLDGSNVHQLGTWLLCYQIAEPGSLCSDKYEQLLRQFVAEKNLALAGRRLGVSSRNT
jgi:hypothetical protein